MAAVFVTDPAGELLYTFDWSADIPVGVALSSVAYTVPIPLDKYIDTPDIANKKSTIGLRGAVHAGLYEVLALATLNSGEKVPKAITIRGFRGGT